MTDDEVEPVALIAYELTRRIREYPPDANQRWLQARATPEQQRQLIFLYAAIVPVDVPFDRLTEWINDPAAYRRRQQARERYAQRKRQPDPVIADLRRELVIAQRQRDLVEGCKPAKRGAA